MLYRTSCEEHKYLAGLRREKEAFEKLIKERGVRAILLFIALDAINLSELVYVDADIGGPCGGVGCRRGNYKNDQFPTGWRTKRGGYGAVTSAFQPSQFDVPLSY